MSKTNDKGTKSKHTVVTEGSLCRYVNTFSSTDAELLCILARHTQIYKYSASVRDHQYLYICTKYIFQVVT